MKIAPLTRIFVFSIAAFFASSCAGFSSVYSAEPDEHVVVFVPGYKGTFLVDSKTKEKVWITPYEALFGRRVLTLNKEVLGFAAVPALERGEIIKSVPVVPLLYSYDGYGHWLRALKHASGANSRLVEFPYDWRRDNVLSAADLLGLVKSLRVSGVHKITIVAHSMGGLLTAYFLRYGGQDQARAVETWEGARLVDDVILLGVPFGGSMLMLHDMVNGTKTVWNKSLLSQSALGSFPSAYEILPYPDAGCLLNSAEEDVSGPIYDANSWKRLGWGLFSENHAGPELSEQRFLYTKQMLERAQTFFAALHRPLISPPEQKRRLLYIRGKNTPTLARALYEDTAEQKILFKEKDGGVVTLYASGDGLVTDKSSELPEAYLAAFDSRNAWTSEMHANLCCPSEVREELSNFLGGK